MPSNTNIIVGYNSNDFFYVKAKEDGIMPTDEECIMTKDFDDSLCSSSNVSNGENAKNCSRNELCKNKENVNTLYNLQNNHGGSNQKYLDTKKKYNDEMLNTLNLGIGIIILSGFIYSKYI